MAALTTPTDLSSNWKALQSKLRSEKGASKPASSAAKPLPTALKRKASKASPTEEASQPAIKRKKIKTTASTSKRPPTRASKMGAYVSSLPTASYAFLPTPTPTASTAPAPAPSTILDPKPGKYIALDCEMVGTHSPAPFSAPVHNRTPTDTASNPERSILARVSLVSYTLETLYDAYVLPPPDVSISDYRTRFSGVTAWHLDARNEVTKPKAFSVVQEEVAALLEGRILVGHALRGDLAVLGLGHPARNVRDTARHPPFRALAGARSPALKKLVSLVLQREIQGGEGGHDSVEDAGAAMELFRRERAAFEREAGGRFGERRGEAEVVAVKKAKKRRKKK